MPALHKVTPQEKFTALRKLGVLFGMFREVAPEVLEARRVAFGENDIILCVLVVGNPNFPAVQRAACATLLDYLFPGWRAGASAAVLGCIVERNSNEVRLWREAVLRRDEFRCVDCGSGQNLEAHHLVRWVDAPHLRVEVDNGRTLCVFCHKEAHEQPWSGAHG